MSGKWYAAGGNDKGQLGLGHTNEVCAFTEVAGDWGKITAVVCERWHTFMRSEHGKWYAVGLNNHGQLGLGHTNKVCAFTEVKDMGGWGKIVAVECGGYHTFMRSEHGKWYATGLNYYGQLGLGYTNNVCAFEEVAGVWGKIVAVECGWRHTFILKGKTCRKCGCCFTPTKLSDEMLMAVKIPDICIDMIFKIIKLYARMSENQDCSRGGYCHC